MSLAIRKFLLLLGLGLIFSWIGVTIYTRSFIGPFSLAIGGGLIIWFAARNKTRF